MKKIIIYSVVVVVLGFAGFVGYTFYLEQRADFGWEPNLVSPTYTSTPPKVVVDQAHYNASVIDGLGRYVPFAKLLRADGYAVEKGNDKFAAATLANIEVLVIVNASGAARPQFLGFNLPIGGDGDRGAPAFTSDEVAAVTNWVAKGGSLLLISDHAPFGAASEALATAFRVKFFKGFCEIPNETSDPMVFSTSNGRLGDHPILRGSMMNEVIHTVHTFTGQSMTGPDSAVILLHLPDSAMEYLPEHPGQEGGEFKPFPAGNAQGLAFNWGNGRVVILGEAAMLTAQVYDLKPFGMNSGDNDNKQFALNIMHWLSRKI
jgi:hypothetical protein